MVTTGREVLPPMDWQNAYLFFSLPLGATEVTGATGRVDVPEESCGKLLSFLGFLFALSLRCSPLAMMCSSLNSRM